MFASYKEWYKSKTIWAGSVTFAVGVASFLGYAISPADQGFLVEAILSVTTAVSGLVAVYGRLDANSKLKG